VRKKTSAAENTAAQNQIAKKSFFAKKTINKAGIGITSRISYYNCIRSKNSGNPPLSIMPM